MVFGSDRWMIGGQKLKLNSDPQDIVTTFLRLTECQRILDKLPLNLFVWTNCVLIHESAICLFEMFRTCLVIIHFLRFEIFIHVIVILPLWFMFFSNLIGRKLTPPICFLYRGRELESVNLRKQEIHSWIFCCVFIYIYIHIIYIYIYIYIYIEAFESVVESFEWTIEVNVCVYILLFCYWDLWTSPSKSQIDSF